MMRLENAGQLMGAHGNDWPAGRTKRNTRSDNDLQQFAGFPAFSASVAWPLHNQVPLCLFTS